MWWRRPERKPLTRRSRAVRKDRIAARRDGFTLIEVLVGLTLMTIGILAMAALAVAVAQSNRGAANRTRADQLLHEKVESFRSFEYDQIVSGADSVDVGGVTFTRAWAVSDDTPEAGLKHVELTGSWDERETVMQTRTSTLVGEY